MDTHPEAFSIQVIQFIPEILFPHYLNGDLKTQGSILAFARAILSSKHTLNRSLVFSTLFDRCKHLFKRYFKQLPPYSGDVTSITKRLDSSSTASQLPFMDCYLKLIEIGCESCPSDIRVVADFCMMHMLQIVESGNAPILLLFLQTSCVLLSLRSLSKSLLIEQVYVNM